MEETIPKLGTEWHEKNLFYKKNFSSKQNWQHVFVRDMLQNGIPSCCLFRGMVRNRISSVCLYFCSTERNFKLFSLPRNGSEQNFERLLLILFHGAEFWAFVSSVEWFGTEFREFSVPRNSCNSAFHSVFRGIIFLSEIANPSSKTSWYVWEFIFFVRQFLFYWKEIVYVPFLCPANILPINRLNRRDSYNNNNNNNNNNHKRITMAFNVPCIPALLENSLHKYCLILLFILFLHLPAFVIFTFYIFYMTNSG